MTSTYTLVALSVEQTAVRAALHALADALAALPDAPTLAPSRAAQLCAGLREVYENCHWRKLDKFLLPVLRRSAAAFEGLLHELEQLSQDAAGAILAAEACVAAGERVARDAFADAAGRCIAALRRRLEREEGELFPLARSVVGGEAWFAVAHQMLAHDAHARERRSVPRRPDAAYFPPLQADAGPGRASLSIAH